MSDPETIRPELAGLEIADPPEHWAALGFAVTGPHLSLGGIDVRLGAQGRGITAWTIRGIDPATTSIDGLSTTVADNTTAERPPETSHPNGAIGLDHVVVATPGFDETSAALAKAGMPLRRIREVGGGAGDEGQSGHPRGSFRQGFRRLGPAILELVESRDAPKTGFWGLVVIVEDLDALAARLGDRLGAIGPAVQPGRQIATLRRSAQLSPAVAFMDPDR